MTLLMITNYPKCIWEISLDTQFSGVTGFGVFQDFGADELM